VPTSIDERENFITAEVGCHACALNKSILAVNGAGIAPFIWETYVHMYIRTYARMDIKLFYK